MKVFFDDKNDFNKDLEELVKKQDRFLCPLVVVPTDKDVKKAQAKYAGGKYGNVTFIDYDYWLSKQWVVDADYDHIDFFRADQFFMDRCFRVQAGVMTVRRVIAKKEKEEK